MMAARQFPSLHFFHSVVFHIFLLLHSSFVFRRCCAIEVDPASIPGCKPTSCGGTNITYPFWMVEPGSTAYCGDSRMGVNCVNNKDPVLETSVDSVRFQVLDINIHTQTARLVYPDALQQDCPRVRNNLTSDAAFAYAPNSDANITFFLNCMPSELDHPLPFGHLPCLSAGSKQSYALLGINSTYSDLQCERVVQVPVLQSALKALGTGNHSLAQGQLSDLLRDGFEVSWKLPVMKDCRVCEDSGGLCGYRNDWGNAFVCYCERRQSKTFCGDKGRMSVPAKILIFTGGLFVAAAACVLTCCIWKYSSRLNYLLGVVDEDQSVEAFLETQKQLALPRYQFSSIKRITSSFSEKLGEGGYGSVFKGKLDDGSLVAVKILNNPNGTGEEFINEVASTCRTNHVNIVSLLGFCSQGSKRALVYEYMPNGSLEKYLFHNDSNTTQLGWEQLYKIAVGIAKGLEYLHRGCKTRIVHFDIKPHNILLDEDLCPKISDFGLAKFCPPKESVLSMVCARGTIGYIAPEVFSRNFGLVTSKSDVYSYGMMVLEMAGGRKNSDLHADNSSEMYFPHWIYDHLDKIGELKAVGLPSLPVETEEVAKKMIMVGLWCIQTNPACRPSINRVVEMLEGRVEDIEMPPRQYLCSPPRPDPAAQEINSYTTSISQS